ncbi:hypothetical protein GPECTOR_23g50 [Gonium pectorale]|uniref:cellulase n=1 Tax=Gonium pectorale TaxID=33097 RepID=A0A150GGZ7_GONPE|nr:hypothetical protein GPECTOR_23g50 [Gonium pectorale]|eukprot:KXZ49121.1 hypothetical protein GPECTOR_23g50 [Gonium pectorale]
MLSTATKLPSELQDGASYRVNVSAAAFGANSSFMVQVNEAKELNTNIRVNQVGYPLSGPKLGFVGAWLGSSTSTSPYVHVALELPGGNDTKWALQDAISREVVATGTMQPYIPVATTDGYTGSPDLYTGQRVWLCDFSSFNTPGRYVLRVPGLGLSHAFLVAPDALRPALGALARGTYSQRCGMALDPNYLSPWGATRLEACHTTDAEVLSVSPPPAWFTDRMPVPTTSNTTTLPLNQTSGSYWLPQQPGGSRIWPVGGHHDAGDYGKYVVNSGMMVGWLMIALEVLNATHDNLPLPEAGDGLPDIMQEVEWELTYLEGMQDADGGVYCVVKPNTTAGEYYEGHLPCGTPGKDACNMAANDPRRGPRIAWPKDTTCTAQFAAAMARAARSRWFKTYRPAAAARYLGRARAAWSFLTSQAPFGAICYHFYGCTVLVTTAEAVRPAWEKVYPCHDPQGDHSADERIWAAVELYAATGEEAFHAYFLQRHCPRYRRYGWQALPFSYGLATITYAELSLQSHNGVAGDLVINDTVARRCLDELASVARAYLVDAKTNPYRLAAHSRDFRIFGYGWFFPTEAATHLLVAAALAGSNATEAAEWRNLAAQQVHYMLGANPQGISLISGIGARRIHNIVDQESVYDDIDPPWPGLPQGISSGFSWLSMYGSALGAAFPPGIDYPSLHRTGDYFDVNTEFTVPNLAQTLGVLAVLAGGAMGPALPPPPSISVYVSPSSGAAPLSVDLSVAISGNLSSIAYVEWDLGDLGHSYQGALTHVYAEPGRVHRGTVTVVDRAGQAATQSFTIFTCWPDGERPALPPPSGLSLVARLAHDAPASSWSGPLPPLLLATTIAAGPDSNGISVAGVVPAGSAASTSASNLVWQGPPSAWSGSALRLARFEDTAAYTLPSGSQALSTLLNGAVGGLALEAWLYVERWLSYSRGNLFMLGLAQGSDRLFGLQGAFGNDTQLGSRLTLGRWHHLRLAATAPGVGGSTGGNGSCSAWVDGQLAVSVPGCNAAKVFDYCKASSTYQLVVGGFTGYVDAVRLYASPASNISALCGPRPPPPRPPPSPAPDNRFSPLTIDGGTLALLDSNSACGLAGAELAARLPLRLYVNGSATGTSLAPSVSSYVTGLSASPEGVRANLSGAPDSELAARLPLRLYVNGSATGTSLAPSVSSYVTGLSASPEGVRANLSGAPDSEVGNTRWRRNGPGGCSLRLGSVGAKNGSAGLAWHIPNAALAAVRASGELSIDAKLFVDAWRTGYSFWNADVLGLVTNWDALFKINLDVWGGGRLYLVTPAANATGAFGTGVLLQNGPLEVALPAGAWHHVALTANSTFCALAANGVELVSGRCNATRLLPAVGSAQNKSALVVGGIRGWVDELRVSSVWRSTQRPGVAVRASGELSIDAKLFVDAWRTGYSFWNADVLGLVTNWDALFKINLDVWGGGRLYLVTPAANATGAFGTGVLLQNGPLEVALPAGSWHHVALTANSTFCALAANGVELVSGRCNATRLLPAVGSAQNKSALVVGGIRGWVDELRVSSVWRSTQRPGVGADVR